MKEDTPVEKLPVATIQNDHFQTEKLSSFEDDATDTRLVNVTRESLKHPWNLTLEATISPISGRRILSITPHDSEIVDISPGDIVCTMNGVRVGARSLNTVESVLKVMSQEVELLMEICGGHVDDDVWGEP